MKRSITLMSMVFAMSGVLASDSLRAQAFGLSDLLGSANGPEQAETHAAGEVVVSDNLGDAAVHAHNILLEEGQGVRFLQVGSGTGVLAMGQSAYQTYDNINATLLSKRASYQRAANQAKRFLLGHFNQPEITCTQIGRDVLQIIDTGSESFANAMTLSEEECRNSISAALSGYVTFSVDDDPANQQVSVTLISTPRTQSEITASTGALIVSSQPGEVFNAILADLATGVAPPMGARLIVNPVNGENVVVGFGSAIRRQNSNANLQRRLAEAANEQARMRAQAALLGTLRGEDVYWEGGFDEAQMEGVAQFETDPSLDAEDVVQVLTEEKSAFLSVMNMSDAYRVVQTGQLPPGVTARTFASEDGYWSFAVAVFSPTLEASARQAAERMRAGREQGTPGAVTGPRTRSLQLGGPTDGAANPTGPRGQVSRESDL
jgi:hypothetical protein